MDLTYRRLALLAAAVACQPSGRLATPPPAAPTADTAPPTTEPSEPAEATGCAPTDVRPCTCAGGEAGTQTCVAPPDTWSACGCDDPDANGEDLYQPPEPPEPMVCEVDGEVSDCPPYRGDDDTTAGANHCCTPAGDCGSKASFLFGDQCLPRGGPVGTEHPACPDEFPNFLDLYGCCRPDGACGLSLDHVSNWDIGCVERTEMAARLNAGSEERDLLSLVFFLPVEPADFGPLRCD